MFKILNAFEFFDFSTNGPANTDKSSIWKISGYSDQLSYPISGKSRCCFWAFVKFCASIHIVESVVAVWSHIISQQIDTIMPI